jgi:hypothetical protein
MPSKPANLTRKRIQMETECWHAVAQLGLERGKSLDDLAQEAFLDLLKKHHKPATLRDALRQSTRLLPANDAKPARLMLRTRR